METAVEMIKAFAGYVLITLTLVAVIVGGRFIEMSTRAPVFNWRLFLCGLGLLGIVVVPLVVISMISMLEDRARANLAQGRFPRRRSGPR